MARPIPQIEDLNKLAEEIKPKETKSIIDFTVDTIRNKSTKNLVLGTLTGWLTGVTVIRVGKIAAFGLGGGVLILHFASEGGYINVNWERIRETARDTQEWMERTLTFLMRNSCFSVGFIGARPRPPSEDPKPAVILRPEPFRLDQPFERFFFPSKPIPHPPNISPSSIPNPNPSITATMDRFPKFAGYLHNIPGYSAFHPVNNKNNQPAPTPMQTETSNPDYNQFTITGIREAEEPADIALERTEEKEGLERKTDTPKQQDFEDNFTVKIIPPSSKTNANITQLVESKSIAPIAQGSEGSISISMQIIKEVSVSVSTPQQELYQHTAFQNAIVKPVLNPEFKKEYEKPKVELLSSIVIKPATPIKEIEVKEKPVIPDRESLRNINPSNLSAVQNNSINMTSLTNVAEAINKNDGQFRVPEPKDVPKEPRDPSTSTQRSVLSPKDISPAMKCIQSSTKQSPIMIGINMPRKVETSKSNTTEPMAMARLDPVSTNESKPGDPSTTQSSTQRSVFNTIDISPAMKCIQSSTKQSPIMVGINMPRKVETSKSNTTEPIAKARCDPVSSNESKPGDPSTTQPSTQRAVFNPIDISPAMKCIQSSSKQSPLMIGINMPRKVETSKSNTTEPIAKARFDPVSTNESKPGDPSTTQPSTQRSVFNPIDISPAMRCIQSSTKQSPIMIGINIPRKVETSKSNTTEPIAKARFDPMSTNESKTRDPSTTQTSTQRAVFNTKYISPAMKCIQSSTKQSPINIGINIPRKVETSKSNTTEPIANARFDPVSTNESKPRDPSPTQPSTQMAVFNPKDISPALKCTQSSTKQSSMFKPRKVETSKSNTTEPKAKATFDPVSTNESKPNPAYSAAIFRTMFIPVRAKCTPTPYTPKFKPKPKPVSAEANKPNSAQNKSNSRAISKPVSAKIKKSLTQTSATPRSKFKQASAERNVNSAQTSATMLNTGSSDSKPNFPKKPPDGGYNESKNPTFLNQKNKNPKMLLTIKPNPQVLLQRTNFESKNLQAPSRLSSQSNKSEVLTDTSSKVVALKRLHQDNGDENDFEKLITENQIYGNKIIVKEKSQVTQEEWKNKVNVENPIEPDWKKQIKIDIKGDKPPENKNVVLQSNFVYLSNVQFPSNLMMIKNNPKICNTTDTNKMQVSPNENRTTDITVNDNNVETNTVVKNPKPQIKTTKEIHILKSSNNVLQTLSNNNNNKTDAAFRKEVNITPQVVFQLPIAVTESDNNHQTAKEAKVPVKNDIISKKIETKSDKMTITSPEDANESQVLISNLIPKSEDVKEVSILDAYEQKKRLRRLKYLSNASKDLSKPEPITDITTVHLISTPAINVVTPDKVEAEIFREFSQTKEEGNNDSESDFEEDELDEYNAIIKKYGADYNENAKADFLAGFSLASSEVFREKQLERHERTLKFDAIASAYMAAGRLDLLADDQTESTSEPQTLKIALEAENKQSLEKQQFFAHFQLVQVSPMYRADYEKSWQCILRERNRRHWSANIPEPFDPDNQLQMLNEINKSVNDNNDLIKKRLDSICNDNSDLRILAEKNFSELNRLSKMADRSVKLFSGKDTNKRDLNPGFDSENIKKFKVDPQHQFLNIPNISKIISPRTDQHATYMSSTQATSMDEPSNCASLGQVRTKDNGCQADEKVLWHKASYVMQNFIKNYREYEITRKKEIDEFHRTTTLLRVECAHVTRAASRDSDRAQALLAELKHLAVEEASLKTSIERITRVINLVRNS